MAASLALFKEIISFSKRDTLSRDFSSSVLNIETFFSNSEIVSSAKISFFAASSYFRAVSVAVASNIATFSSEKKMRIFNLILLHFLYNLQKHLSLQVNQKFITKKNV